MTGGTDRRGFFSGLAGLGIAPALLPRLSSGQPQPKGGAITLNRKHPAL